MVKGWFGNSEKHSLSSKGIKTTSNTLVSKGKYDEGRPFDDFYNAMIDEGFKFIDAFENDAFGYGNSKFPTFEYMDVLVPTQHKISISNMLYHKNMI